MVEILKKIAYIEIDTHAEVAEDFMDIMEDSKEFSVDYYFSEKIKNRISRTSDGVFLSDQSMILNQLKRNKYDLIIIGTVHRYFNTFLSITKKYKTAVIVHNLNFSRTSSVALFKNIFKEDVVYRLKLLLKEDLLNAAKVYSSANCLCVLDENLSSEKHQFLPLFYTRKYNETENEVLTIVIPGGVSQKRRDYHHIINVIKNSKKARKIKFIFLGKASGVELKEILDLKRDAQDVDVIFFTERISQQEFEIWVRKADLIWCPIQQETEFFSQVENYGQTKMTGNIGDAIKFGKVAVFPKNYSTDSEFIFPEKENVIQQFYDLKNFQFDFQKKFNKKVILERLEEKLSRII